MMGAPMLVWRFPHHSSIILCVECNRTEPGLVKTTSPVVDQPPEQALDENSVQALINPCLFESPGVESMDQGMEEGPTIDPGWISASTTEERVKGFLSLFHSELLTSTAVFLGNG